MAKTLAIQPPRSFLTAPSMHPDAAQGDFNDRYSRFALIPVAGCLPWANHARRPLSRTRRHVLSPPFDPHAIQYQHAWQRGE